MELFHGTDVDSAISICKQIELNRNGSKNLDFGPGFYTTTSKSGAEKWALRKARIRNKDAAIVVIQFDYEKAIADRAVQEFQNDLRWGRFIINNRNGYDYIDKIPFKEHNLDSKYDITYGRIADYDVSDVANELKNTNRMLDSINSIINPLYSYQYAFHTQASLSYIKKTTFKPKEAWL